MTQNASDILMAKLGAVLDDYVSARTEPAMLLPANDYFDLAGEEFGRRLMLTQGNDGQNYCLRPDFTLPIAQQFMREGARGPKDFGYWGKVFRQRLDGPAEFTQSGLELLDYDQPAQALERALQFTLKSLAQAEVADLSITFGSVAMFEKVLVAANIPAVWQPRLRHRFGNAAALDALIDRLAQNQTANLQDVSSREELIEQITDMMVRDGMSLTEGRTPDEIADRYLEKQALKAARVDNDVIAFLRDYLKISGPLNDALGAAKTLCAAHNIDISEQAKALEDQAQKLTQAAPQISLDFATAFAPRLHYYTGLVFEAHSAAGKVLASGGQYDRLLQSLGADEEVSASGVALWVERILEAANV